MSKFENRFLPRTIELSLEFLENAEGGPFKAIPVKKYYSRRHEQGGYTKQPHSSPWPIPFKNQTSLIIE